MNVLMVNPTHPATPHISAMRAWRFAQELVRAGDRVALLTAAGGDGSLEHGAAASSEPAIVSVRSGPEPVRGPAAGRLSRRIRTAWNMIRYGGNMTEWVTECERMVDERLLGFRPDVIWCTFGRMESALLARSLARRFGCPWVLDLKDNWDLYVPRGLRRLMAWRTRGWSRVTANARFTAEKARRWQRTEADIVYSGVEDAFFSPLAGADASDRLTVNVVGSVYSDVRLRALLHGIGLWAESLDDTRRARVLVCYMGPDARRFADVSRDLARIVAVGVEGYVGVERMAAACRSAVANTYVKHDGTFHHKLLELLSCGVPVVVVPSESEESRRLAGAVGGALHECPDAAVVADTIGALSRRPRPPAQLPVAGPAGAEYSWASQSVRLRAVLRSVVHMNEEDAL